VRGAARPHELRAVPTAILCDAWSQAFGKFPNVEVVEGDFFSQDADAMVSPANSFGIMDGGLDLAIRDALGPTIQNDVQRVSLERHHGETAGGELASGDEAAQRS